MRINRSIYNEIVNMLISEPPEIGGIVGGDGYIVQKHYLDKGLASAKACSYTPNISLLNDIISKWNMEKVCFMGIYHTHFNDVQTLSDGDIKYIRKIMYSMPTEIERLYFPLVVLPSRIMVCYKAVKKPEGIEIYKDNLDLI